LSAHLEVACSCCVVQMDLVLCMWEMVVCGRKDLYVYVCGLCAFKLDADVCMKTYVYMCTETHILSILGPQEGHLAWSKACACGSMCTFSHTHIFTYTQRNHARFMQHTLKHVYV
jgi:hypothetical protein